MQGNLTDGRCLESRRRRAVLVTGKTCTITEKTFRLRHTHNLRPAAYAFFENLYFSLGQTEQILRRVFFVIDELALFVFLDCGVLQKKRALFVSQQFPQSS